MSRTTQIEHYVFPSEGFVRLSGVLAVFPVSRSHFLTGVREGKYPAGIRLSGGIVAWRVEEIRDLIARAERGELVAAEPRRRGPGRPRKSVQTASGLHVAAPIVEAMATNFQQTGRFFPSEHPTK